ncbi:hypothetical protein VTN77DRAFT_3018 [Rasamsonia byssochlamydoides]|uniref:uncharacterized protein n=1 Tax=Rasamsonia byssochlamydoides TaxID=89139 RepID=UPI003743EC70
MPTDKEASTSQGAKSKKNKKNKNTAKSKADGSGDNNDAHAEDAAGEASDNSEASVPIDRPHDIVNGTPGEDKEEAGTEAESQNDIHKQISEERNILPVRGGKQLDKTGNSAPSHIDTEKKLDALVRERDSLRAEVIEMRKSLEEIQQKHQEEMGALRCQLSEAEGKKEHAEHQFQKLLEKVNTIKSQLGERMKEDAEELAQARSRIEELEEQNSNLKTELEMKVSEIAELERDAEQRSKELSSLRNRTNLSQQNWLKEKEELLEQEAYLRAEFEEAKQAMHNWEVLAMEERSIREGLGEKVVDLEEQLSALREEYEKATAECNSQSVTVDGLQRALQEIQTARKQELRELVQSSDAQLEELRKSLQDAEKRAAEANSALQSAQKELERLQPFEKEVKEKNLLIGKLRHEAVTLNDHLTKALRFLKRGKPEDNVDRHIVTNHLLHFLALDRSDPKKFEILQLIAALLQWTDDQREQAGLARPGASNASSGLRAPSFSVHRTPSTPSLATEYFENGSTGKETLAELWSNFLEQEAQAGSGNASRSGAPNAGLKSP